MRYLPYLLSLAFAAGLLFAGLYRGHWSWGLWAALPLALLGTRDYLQRRHTLLRNYPILAHARWLIEAVRPELRQYLFESDTDAAPFSRVQRSLVYQRAKGVLDKRPFGTQLEVAADGYEWINPSITPAGQDTAELFRIDIGGPQCRQPYSASVLNVSAMSFGALSGRAVSALNAAAASGGFAQDTGEGGISRYHREHGGDLIWEIGSGYFGCRDADGRFDPERYAEQACQPQVKMIELKLSQGAKPGHGGVLPGAKVSAEIAAARGVPEGRDCISPSSHSTFSTPLELLEFIARLRELSGGKPTGFKLCIGHGWELLAICKAMLESRILPDFIVVDGAEGGTGAAPLELSNHVGTPLREGLIYTHNALVGVGLRSQIRLGAAGKIISGFNMAANMALGADWCNSGRGFMFSLGCVQSRNCHNDRCPTGITTQNPWRQRGLVVADKAERAARFHRATVRALGEVVAAAGLEHPAQLRPKHLSRRMGSHEVHTADHVYRFLRPGELLEGTDDPAFRRNWDKARADSFLPASRR